MENKCPSCFYVNPSDVQYCGRCRMSFSSFQVRLSGFKTHLAWILRRAGAGFSTGLVAWLFIPIVSRIISESNSEFFIFALTGLMGGAFLGCVDGMVEESSPKTIRGAMLGGIGGVIGGILFVYIRAFIPEEQILWALFFYWAIVGSFIGVVSALWERQAKKIFFGIVSGFIGGGIGGYLGAAVHANLIQQFQPESWLVQRFYEGLVGGFIGLCLWFSIGAAERFVIFKRRLVRNKDFKECDQCQAKNPLSSWYCGTCGCVLQVSVPAGKLNFPPYGTLMRLSEMFRFLSRLSAATGFIAGFVSLFIFVPGPPFVLVGVLVLTAIFSYSGQVLFSSVSESLQILIKR